VVEAAEAEAAEAEAAEGFAAEAEASISSTVDPAADGAWWEVVDSSTAEGAGRAKDLGGALQAFASTVEVAGAPGDG
jgi:hypothetical protein